MAVVTCRGRPRFLPQGPALRLAPGCDLVEPGAVTGSEAGGKTAALLYTVVGTCKHLGIDSFAYLQEALVGLFALGEKPKDEQLLEWLPDAWQQRKARDAPGQAATG